VADRVFIKTPYSAYLNRADATEDVELTHVGPGTPGGEYLRRFWQPVAFVAEVKDRPKRIPRAGRGPGPISRRQPADTGFCNFIAAIVVHRWSSGWYPTRACAAAITAGCTTLMERSLRLPRKLRKPC
jgi:hypothetical protein